jgi:hypothetical protein
VRRAQLWSITLPLALMGIEGAHALANALVGAPYEQGEIFGSAGSGAPLLGPLLMLAPGIVLVAAARRAAGLGRLPRSSRAVLAPFAVVPPLGFVLLEIGEGIAHSGGVEWHDLLTPAFAAGFLLQGPVALVGVLVTRALLAGSERVRAAVVRALVRIPLVLGPDRSFAPREHAVVSRALPAAHRGRAPPLRLA